MRLLLDQDLPFTAAAFLRSRGHDAIHASEVGLKLCSDAEILEYAVRTERIVVAIDADHHGLLANSRATAPSVVRIRRQGLDGEAAAELIHRVIVFCAADLIRGAVASVGKNIRLRLLPLK